MLLKLLFLALSVIASYAIKLQENLVDNIWTENDQVYENQWESKITLLLHKMQAETNAKLMEMERNIMQKLSENTSNKIQELEHNLHLIQQQTLLQQSNTRYQVEERALLDKIEKGVDHIQGKIVELEKCSTQIEMDNKNLKNVINTKLEDLGKLINQVDNATSRFDKKYDALETVYQKMSEQISIAKNISIEHMDTIQKEIQELKNVTPQVDVYTKKIENLDDKLEEVDELLKRTQNVTCQNDSTVAEILQKKSLQEIKDEKMNLCKKHSAHGYGYKPILRLDGVDENYEYVKRNENSDYITDFEMHLAVKSDKEAQILLTSRPQLQIGDKGIYEIVMGVTGTNNFTEIRTRLGYASGIKIETPNILSPTQYKTFTLRITQGKDLEFVENTIDGEKLVISHCNDVNIRQMKYLSFSAYNENAWFLYDCPKW